MAAFDPKRLAEEAATAASYTGAYKEGDGKGSDKGDGKGYDAYHNTKNGFPRDKNGKPTPPAGAVVALVNGECKYCHAFLALSNYPTQTADGRKIYYIDMHTAQGQKDAEALGLKGDAGKDAFNTIAGKQQQLNGKPLRERDGTAVPQGMWPILLDVQADGKLSSTVYSSGIIDGVERITGQPIEVAKKRMGTPDKTVTNTDIKGDTSDQHTYMALKPAQKDLVDRAVYGAVMRREDPKVNYNDSQEVEVHIEGLREKFAAQATQRGGAAQLEASAKGAPDAATSRRMLNAVIAAFGDQCGCDFGAPEINLSNYIPQRAATAPQKNSR